MTKMKSKDYWDRPLREIYKDVKITWTTKGIVNGKSKILNDGCDFGPDTVDKILNLSKWTTYKIHNPLSDVRDSLYGTDLLRSYIDSVDQQLEPNSTLGLYDALMLAKSFSEAGHKVIIIHMEDGKEVLRDRLVIK